MRKRWLPVNFISSKLVHVALNVRQEDCFVPAHFYVVKPDFTAPIQLNAAPANVLNLRKGNSPEV